MSTTLTYDQALDKLQKYCAYQERCHQEVRSKLLSLHVYGEKLERVIAALVSENFLNEERFAISYARGKYRMKKWGRERIIRELKARHVSNYCIKKALDEVEAQGGYLDNLHEVLYKYTNQRKLKWSKLTLRQNAINHALTKGYEYSLIKEEINHIMDEVFDAI